MMKNQLAIVIPYYKIDFFEETLKSISKQTDKNFTLYIGNDASPNDPLPLIKEYFEEGKYNYYNYLENLGGKNLAMQWERILENVSEDWFQILGDDDIIAENFVEEFYKQIDEVEENKINVIKISQYWIDEENLRLNQDTASEKIINAKDQFLLEFYHQYRSSLSEHIFCKHKFDLVGFKKIPLAWHTDNLAVFEVSDFSTIYFINETKIMVRMSGVNISNSDNYNEQKILAKHLYREYLLKNFNKKFQKSFLIEELKNYREDLWRNNLKSNVPLFSLYIKLGFYRKALGSLIHKK